MGPLPVGSILRNRYRISKILYQSKLTNVYTVEDTHLVGNIWAIKEMKVLALSGLQRQKVIANFQAEILKLTELAHPNLARVIDFFVEGRNLYIVREFIPAYDVEILMSKSNGKLRERDVLSWGMQLCDCLTYLFSKKYPAIFFRELKLGNILVNSEGIIKIIDLGLADLFQTETNPQKLELMGSMDYAAPEQFEEYGTFDQRSLVYSTGAMMFHMLSGQSPASSLFNLPPLDQLNPEVSRAVREIIRKATANEPRTRYQTLLELKKDLQRARKDPDAKPSVSTISEADARPGLNFMPAFLITVGLLVAAAIVFFIYKFFFNN